MCSTQIRVAECAAKGLKPVKSLENWREAVTSHTSRVGSVQFIVSTELFHHFYPVRITEGCWSFSKGSSSQRQESTPDNPAALWLTRPHSLTLALFCWFSVVRQKCCRSYSLFKLLSFFHHSAVLGSPSECVKRRKVCHLLPHFPAEVCSGGFIYIWCK